jgi:signal transduction histidine kinase
LIAIFLLTIFLPSVLLSIFGILALRNEKFRLEKQFEEEQLRIAEQFKSQVGSNIRDAENVLQLLGQSPLLINKEYEEIEPLLDAKVAENRLLGQFFIVYKDTRPWFFHFRIDTGRPLVESTLEFNDAQQGKLKRAERYEFIQNNYTLAISIFEELQVTVRDRNLQGQILNHIARNLLKSRKYQEAAEIYSRIINDFPISKTSTGIPLAITARLQLIDCYLESGEDENALIEALRAFNEILLNWGDLTENQLKTYTSMAIEAFTNILDKKPDTIPAKEKYVIEFEHLQADYQDKIAQWQIINDLKNECIPELQREFLQTNTYSQNTFRYSKTIGDENFLILSSLIPDKNKTGAQGILGVKINSVFFESDLLKQIIEEVRLNENTNLLITDLQGRVIFGEKIPSNELSGITSFFDDNFPPWRIEITNNQFETILFKGVYKSFYFWTILTIIIILIFGVFLIMRTIVHEMDVLKLKSELVSSVSHEFKTPITSIKALAEMLLDEKVKDPTRMKEYYSVILWDADNLSRLVSNFLDSTMIEEAKKQYDFEETNIKQWMTQTITDFKNKCPQKEIKFNSRFSADIPPIAIDKNAMEQAINNLLDNAIKFSSGKIVVEIIVEKDENNLLLKVSDNGIGIHKEDLNKIFEKFYRGRNAPRHTSTGTGLGLTLVRQIIEAHRGEISVDSKVGSGSTFTIILPLRNNIET